jgi:GTP pyrophosphokinase
MVPLETHLQNGDIVEIVTSKQPTGPSRDWVCMVKTAQAKNRIRQWFKKEKREENIVRGKDGLEREARKMGFDVAKDLSRENIQKMVELFRFNSLEDLYATLGDGAVTYRRALYRLREEILPAEQETEFVFKPATPQKSRGKGGQRVKVKGMDNMLVRFSRCCNPLPGDDVIGFITRGRGVSVHKKNCPEMKVLAENERERLIEVDWESYIAEDEVYPVNVDVRGADRPTLVMDIMNSLMETKTHVLNLNANAGKDGIAHVHLKIETRSVDHLDFLLGRLRRLREVTSVIRV